MKDKLVIIKTYDKNIIDIQIFIDDNEAVDCFTDLLIQSECDMLADAIDAGYYQKGKEEYYLHYGQIIN